MDEGVTDRHPRWRRSDLDCDRPDCYSEGGWSARPTIAHAARRSIGVVTISPPPGECLQGAQVFVDGDYYEVAHSCTCTYADDHIPRWSSRSGCAINGVGSLGVPSHGRPEEIRARPARSDHHRQRRPRWASLSDASINACATSIYYAATAAVEQTSPANLSRNMDGEFAYTAFRASARARHNSDCQLELALCASARCAEL